MLGSTATTPQPVGAPVAGGEDRQRAPARSDRDRRRRLSGGDGGDLAGIRLDRKRLLLVCGDRGRVQPLPARQRREVRGALRAGLLEHERRLRRLLREAEQVALLRRELPRERRSAVLRLPRLLDHDAVLVGDPVERVEVREGVRDRGGAEHDRQRVAVALLIHQRQPRGERPLRDLQRVLSHAEPLLCRGELALHLGGPDPQRHESRALACEPRVERVQLEHDAARAGREVGVLLRERRGVVARSGA